MIEFTHKTISAQLLLIVITLSVPPPAGIDYVGISRNLDFAPGVSMQTFKVTILDDLGQPELEGTEHFELVLRMPVQGILGDPDKATVFINDSVSDCKWFDILAPWPQGGQCWSGQFVHLGIYGPQSINFLSQMCYQ